MEGRVNYFKLLNLKPDATQDEITRTIKAKETEWQKAKNSANSKKQNEAMRGLGMIDDIKRVLLSGNSAEHTQQVSEAKKMIQQSETQMKIVLAGMDQLGEKDIANLLKEFGTCGMNENDIRRLYKNARQEVETVDTVEREFHKEDYLDEKQALKIEKALRAANMEDMTLYDFLGRNRTVPAGQLLQEAEHIQKMTSEAGQQVTENGPKLNLCKICIEQFATEQSKKQYDNYLYLMTFGGGRGASISIDAWVKSDPEHIFRQNKAKDFIRNMYLSNATLTVDKSLDYIEDYCHYKGYEVEALNRPSLYAWFTGELAPQASVGSGAATWNGATAASGTDETARKEFKKELEKGKYGLEEIQKCEADIAESEGLKYEAESRVAEYRNEAEKLRTVRSGGTQVERNQLIGKAVACGVLLLLLIVANFRSIGVSYRTARGVGLTALVVILLIALIAVGIWTIVSLVRFGLSISADNTLANQYAKGVKEYEDYVKSIESQIQALEEEKERLRREWSRYFILPDQYSNDPRYYEIAQDYVNRGLADNINDIVELLQTKNA